MIRIILLSGFFFSLSLGMSAQEIIPFPDLSEHYEHNKNGGKSLDERNYAMFTEDYQDLFLALDQQMDEITAQRTKENDQARIDELNQRLDQIRKKKISLLEEAQLVEDLQKFY